MDTQMNIGYGLYQLAGALPWVAFWLGGAWAIAANCKYNGTTCRKCGRAKE